MYEDLDDIQSVIISKAMRCKIFMAFGLDLLNFEVEYNTNLPNSAPAATDYEKIYINPESDILNGCTGSMTKETLMTFFLMHESLHPKLFHDKRRGDRDPEIWDISCDYVINLLLHNLELESKNLSGGSPLVDMKISHIDGIMFDEKYKNMTEEEVYELLKKKIFRKTISEMSMGDDDGESQPGNGRGSSDDDEPINGKVKVTKTKFYDGHTEVEHISYEFSERELDPSEQDAYNDRRIMARQMLESTLLKGDVSASVKKFLGKLFHVKVDWRKITKDSLMTAFEKSHSVSWGTPRMAWMANPSMPYLPNVDEEEKYGVVIVAIDESGSMTDANLISAVDIIRQSKEFYKGLLVIKHDSSVRWKKYYKNIEDIDIDELLMRRHLGGTSHAGVFEEVTKFSKENPDDMISCFIGVSDMCSDIDRYQETMDTKIPRIWLTCGDYPTDDIMGRVIKID
jgi:predicted metal-dependent peptidase